MKGYICLRVKCKKRSKKGEEVTEEISEKSGEQKIKDQGACKGGRLFAGRAKNSDGNR